MKFEPPHLLAIECNPEDPESVRKAVDHLAEVVQDLHGIAFAFGATFAAIAQGRQDIPAVLEVLLSAHESNHGRSPLAEMVRGGMESWESARTPSVEPASLDGA